MKLFFDDQRNILLVKFDGILSNQALEVLCTTIRQWVQHHGKCRGILDLTDTTQVTATSQQIATIATRPILQGEQRVIVAPSALLYAISRMFQANQELSDIGEHTEVVHSMQEAYQILHIDHDDFEPCQ